MFIYSFPRPVTLLVEFEGVDDVLPDAVEAAGDGNVDQYYVGHCVRKTSDQLAGNHSRRCRRRADKAEHGALGEYSEAPSGMVATSQVSGTNVAIWNASTRKCHFRNRRSCGEIVLNWRNSIVAPFMRQSSFLFRMVSGCWACQSTDSDINYQQVCEKKRPTVRSAAMRARLLCFLQNTFSGNGSW